MADTFTTNLNLTKPEVGASTDTWGTKINADLDALDAIFAVAGTAVNVKFASANFDDNAKAIFGTGDDLEIYHDGSNSYIKDGGTGDLRIASNDLYIKNGADTETKAYFLDNGAVGLYFDDAVKFATTSSGATVTGTLVATALDISGDVDIDGTLETDNLTIGSQQGTDGQVLTSTGSGVAWENAAGTTINNNADNRVITGSGTANTLEGEANVIIDAESNISFGTQKVDPNWSQFFNAISGNYGGHLSFQNNNVPVTSLGNNFYINNSTLFERVLARAAQQYQLDHLGNFLWQTAASGTAGATFSFTERMRLNNAGQLLIGQTAAVGSETVLQVSGSDRSGGVVGFYDTDASTSIGNIILRLAFTNDNDCTNASFIHFADGDGTIGSVYANNASSVVFSTVSDERLKENIVDASSQLQLVKDIKVREFDWKKDGTHQVGFIAQELNNLVPEAVVEGGEDVKENAWGVDYGKLTPYLIKAVQELSATIDELKTEIQTLKG